MVRTIPLYTLEGVPDCETSTHHISSGDGLGLSMLRFNKAPSRDVVLLLHGLTTSSDMFIMPEHDNLVRYLHRNGFTDVWCFDNRMSNRHAYNLLRHRYTMDHVALFDYPPALARIREVAGPDVRIHVIAHCLGSASFTMSLFAGIVEVSSLISNSIALTPRVPGWSKVKLKLAPFLVEYVLQQPYASPNWGAEPGLTIGKIVAKVLGLAHRECDNSACHMLSFMWGTGFPALYHHENLLPVTHARGCDLYGATSLHYHRHVNRMVKAGRAVKYDPRDSALAALPSDYFERAAAVKTPVLCTTGIDNKVFTDSNVHCHERLEKITPGLHELAVFDGYGHQDVFMGKDVATDIFPRMLSFLEKHARGGQIEAETAAPAMPQLVATVVGDGAAA
jgi:lysosomal acid lipase/cholesteryl ester hydrolase